MTDPMTLPELIQAVAEMRRLGVVEWNGIKLGPVPAEAPTSDQDETQRIADAKAAELKREERKKFGASGGPRRVDSHQ